MRSTCCTPYPLKKGVIVLDNIVTVQTTQHPGLSNTFLLLFPGHALQVHFLHGIDISVHLSYDFEHHAIAARANLFLNNKIVVGAACHFLCDHLATSKADDKDRNVLLNAHIIFSNQSNLQIKLVALLLTVTLN